MQQIPTNLCCKFLEYEPVYYRILKKYLDDNLETDLNFEGFSVNETANTHRQNDQFAWLFLVS